MEQLLDHRPWCLTDLGPNIALPLKCMAGYLRTLSEPQYGHLQIMKNRVWYIWMV